MEQTRYRVIIYIDGTSGSGKSTLQKNLSNQLMILYPETMIININEAGESQELPKVNGRHLLDLYREDRRKWAYAINTSALGLRYKNLQREIDKAGDQNFVILFDRSPQMTCDIVCGQGYMTEKETEDTKALQRTLQACHVRDNPDIRSYHMFIDVSVQEAKRRIEGRNQVYQEEHQVSQHRQYAELASKYNPFVIDPHRPPEQVCESVLAIVQKLLN